MYRRSRIAVVISCIFFVAATTVAMMDYPGGTHLDPDTDGYRFLDNTFSELGRTEGYRGEAKLLSFVLFLLATLVAGTGLITFFAIEAVDARLHGGSRIATTCTMGFGVITGLGFIGIDLTPTDVVKGLHYAFVYAAFFAYIPSITALLAAWWTARSASRRRCRLKLWTYGSFLVVLAVYFLLITLLRGAPLETVHAVLTAGQKVIVYAALGVVALICVEDLWRGECSELHPRAGMHTTP